MIEDDEEPGLTPIGSQITKTDSSQWISDLLPTTLRQNIATTGSEKRDLAEPNSIGRLLSATGAAELRAAMATGDPRTIEGTLVDLLSPYVSLSQHPIHTDNPYTTCAEHRTVVAVHCNQDQLADVHRLLDQAMLPAPRSETIKALARMRTLTVSRSTDAVEGGMILSAFADELAQFPADAVMAALQAWPREHKFWPALSEILDLVKNFAHARFAIEARIYA